MLFRIRRPDIRKLAFVNIRQVVIVGNLLKSSPPAGEIIKPTSPDWRVA